MTSDHPTYAEAADILRAIAFGAMAPGTRLPTPVLSAVLRLSAAESSIGLVVKAVDDGIVVVDEDQRRLIDDWHRPAMIHCLNVERAALRVCAALTEAGVRSLLLKGVALAHLIYADPMHRSFNDVDLLIHPDDVVEALEVVTRLGATRHLPERRPGFDLRFAKDITFVLDGVGVDLHRTLIDPPYGDRLNLDELFGRSRAVRVGGHDLECPDANDLYIHAALTAGAGDRSPRAITLRDIRQLSSTAHVDPSVIIQRVQRCGLDAAVARGIIRSNPANAVDDLAAWATSVHPRGWERIVLASYSAAGAAPRRLIAMAEMRSWQQRAAFARSLVAPSPAYRNALGATRRAYLARWRGMRPR